MENAFVVSLLAGRQAGLYSASLCLQFRSICLGIVPPTVAWALLYQLNKEDAPRQTHAHWPTWHRQFLTSVSPPRCVLGCVKLTVWSNCHLHRLVTMYLNYWDSFPAGSLFRESKYYKQCACLCMRVCTFSFGDLVRKVQVWNIVK